jgi:uncharacterized protein (DUF952 family)
MTATLRREEGETITTIIHITSEHEWEQALRLGRYAPESLAREGFIHCSNPQQVIRVANALYRGIHALVLLHVEVEKLSSAVVYENLEGGVELFPHVYGPIELEAVRTVTRFEPAADGRFDHHSTDLGNEPAWTVPAP